MTRVPLRDRFLVRSEPKAGESREGYLWRLCAANGHRLPFETREALSRLRHLHIEADSSGAEELIGQELDSQMRQQEAQVFASIKGKALSQWMKRSKYPKFCPLCIKEDPCHHLLWKMPLAEACPTHGCLLIDACTVCGRRLIWRTLGPTLGCTCGEYVQSMYVRPARPWQIQLAGLLAGAFDFKPSGQDKQTAAYGLSDVYNALNWAWSIRHLMTRPDIYPSQGWQVTQRKRDRPEPKAWEVNLLLQSSDRLRERFEKLLQLRFFHSTDVLVQLRADPLIRMGLDAVEELSLSSNPIGRHAEEAIRSNIEETSAGIESMPDVCFNPWTDAERRKRLKHNWEGVVRYMVRHGRSSRAGPAVGSGGGVNQMPRRWTYHPNDLAVMIVNKIFDSAARVPREEDARAFAMRWPFPERLLSSTNLLSDMAAYLRDIRPGEQVYVLTLAEHMWEQTQMHRPEAAD